MENTISFSENVPEFLYHYTTIETLAYILSTKKIRFNALTQVDDMMEGKSTDFEYIGQYFLVSCWTDLEEENIPFWNIYSKDMKGVRIKLPSDLFSNKIIETQGIAGPYIDRNYSIVSQAETFKQGYWILPTSKNYLRKVTYTDDLEKLHPTLKTIIGDEFQIQYKLVGAFKSKLWEFQSEWRFILIVFPLSNNPIFGNDYLQDSFTSFTQGVRIPITDYFVELDSVKFKQMEILLGPKHNNADKIMVESLINTYNPTAILKVSHLHNKIR